MNALLPRPGVARPWRLWLLAWLGALACIGVLLASEWMHFSAQQAMAELRLVYELRRGVFVAQQRIGDVESAQRAFLRSGRTEYLGAYREAERDLAQELRELRQLIAQDPTALALLERLDLDIQRRLSEAQQTLVSHDPHARAHALAIVDSGIGTWHTDAVRQSADAVIARAEEALLVHRQRLQSTLGWGRGATAGVAVLAMLALLLYLRRTAQWHAAEAAHLAAVQVERDLLEQTVARRTAELSELTQQLQILHDDDRRRMALRLHDDLGSELTALKLDLTRLRRQVRATAAEPVIQRLDHADQVLRRAVVIQRRAVEDLAPSALHHIGLDAAMEALCAEFRSRGLSVDLALGEFPDMPEAVRIVAYRAVEQALDNAWRHASAGLVKVTLRAEGGELQLQVTDDGSGFDEPTSRRRGLGLRSLRHRVHTVGGRLDVRSHPGLGTGVSVRLPLTLLETEPKPLGLGLPHDASGAREPP